MSELDHPRYDRLLTFSGRYHYATKGQSPDQWGEVGAICNPASNRGTVVSDDMGYLMCKLCQRKAPKGD